MQKRKSSDLIKRFTAYSPQSIFCAQTNLETKMDLIKNELGIVTNISSSFEDNSEYYERFFKTLQNQNQRKNKDTRRSSLIKDINVKTQASNKINKNEIRQEHLLNPSNKMLFSINTKNIYSSKDIMSNIVQSKDKKPTNLNINNKIIQSQHLEKVQSETIINSNSLLYQTLIDKNKHLNNNTQDNKPLSKTIQINSNSNNNSPIKHSKTNKMSHPLNNRTQVLETCPIKRKNRSSVKNKKVRNWLFCCLPIK